MNLEQLKKHTTKPRNSHRKCTIKKLFLKISQYSQKTPGLESLFDKVVDSNTVVFVWILRGF